MLTAQVVETSVTVNNNSPIQDYVHPDDQIQPTFDIYYYYYYCEVYEIIQFWTAVEMNVKNDHRSKFSNLVNLSNWKEEAWKKKSGFQRASNRWKWRMIIAVNFPI